MGDTKGKFVWMWNGGMNCRPPKLQFSFLGFDLVTSASLCGDLCVFC